MHASPQGPLIAPPYSGDEPDKEDQERQSRGTAASNERERVELSRIKAYLTHIDTPHPLGMERSRKEWCRRSLSRPLSFCYPKYMWN